jgi:hypothetical protein
MSGRPTKITNKHMHKQGQPTSQQNKIKCDNYRRSQF